MNAYQLFLKDEKPSLVGTIAQQAVHMGKAWAALQGTARKESYEAAASSAKNAYYSEIARLKTFLKS